MTALISLYLCSMIAGFVYRIVALMDRRVYNLFMSRWGFLLIFGFHVIPALIVSVLLYKSYVAVEDIRLETLTVSV
jgi:hypothetical protein